MKNLVSARITDRTWYDAAGNVAKQQPAGSQAFTRTFYDGVGRPIKGQKGDESN